MAERSQFPYPYGSDLHWLWGWGARLSELLSEPVNRRGEPIKVPSEFDWIVFLPDRAARDAMMRFSIKYPQIIKQIDDCLDFTDARFKEFTNDKNESTEGNFVRAMHELLERIEKGVAIIAEQEHPMPHGSGSTKPNWVVKLDPPQVTLETGDTFSLSPDAALLLNAMLSNFPDWISASALEISKPKRVADSCPKAIQNCIESQSGKGYRIKPK